MKEEPFDVIAHTRHRSQQNSFSRSKPQRAGRSGVAQEVLTGPVAAFYGEPEGRADRVGALRRPLPRPCIARTGPRGWIDSRPIREAVCEDPKKNDYIDAEATERPTMQFVPIKNDD
jgi:hypothetical protein